eukprot:12906840-Prorocentrum_lima.AAC.1
MKNTLASDMTTLEGTIPNGRDIEERLMELDGSILETTKRVQGLDRRLSFVVDQVDQLEENLGQPVPDRGQPASRAPPGLPQ